MSPNEKNPAVLFLVLFSFSFLVFSCKKEITKNEAISSTSTETAVRNPPNIILILADDVGREIPHYNGGDSYSTPNLDFMAANGINFSDFFAHPDGPPSRLALVTGRYNYRNWVEFGQLPASEKTFANLLHNAGYATCYTGKWQFDGGDTNIVNHGFDKYLAFMPFEPDNNNGHDQFYRRYKNPYLYSNARYLTDAEVEGKYSEDMFFDYASNFIDSNKTKPFLLVYSCNLVQKPWVPTPDNPAFLTWNPATDDDTKDSRAYFREMVQYMDKIVGKIIQKIQTGGLSQNTIIMFTSDNATNKNITSVYKGQTVKGTKATTTFYGTNVPLLVYAPGLITVPGTTDTSLVDMTDFFPTMANIARVGATAWKPLDGKTFYDNLIGTPLKQRKYVYCYWPQYFRTEPEISYVFDYNYKLYDSTNGSRFYNIKLDQNEQFPLTDNQLTSNEKKIKQSFQTIIDKTGASK